MTASLIAAVLLGATHSPPTSVLPWLELQHTQAKANSASLLSEAEPEAPQAFDRYLMADIRVAMGDELIRFSNEVLPEGRSLDRVGAGDDVGAWALLCGILGFFPGFGIGHLVAGNLTGFVIFLVIDIVLAGVFWIWFPLWPGFVLWYVPGLIVFLVERIVEAFLAAASATRYYHYRYADSDLAEPGGVRDALPSARAPFTILRF